MPMTRTADCPHELRPGLTVCLHCRRAQRDVKSARTRRILSRTAWGTVGFALCVGIGYAGATAVKSGRTPAELLSAAADLVARAQAAVPIRGLNAPAVVTARSTSPIPAPVSPPAPADTQTAVGPPAGPHVTAQELPLNVPFSGPSLSPASGPTVAAALAPTPAPPAPAPAPPARYAPRIAEGRTPLGTDGLYAVREGDVVRVHFDTELGRTRRPAKFEQIVRSTLPAILGAAADSLLRQVPAGRIAASGDLLAELPTRGVELRHVDGRSLTVWPETRQGRDGLLVVAYRVKGTP